jgi:hypothetical protein
MSSSTGAGTGIAQPCAISCPGGGGNCDNQNNSAFSGIQASFHEQSEVHASGGGSVGWGLGSTSFNAGASQSIDASTGAQTGSNNVQNSSSCPPNVNQTSVTTNKRDPRETSDDTNKRLFK